MSRTAAFFDFDGTLIDGYSAMAFLSSRARGGEMPTGEMLRLLRAGLDMRSGKAEFDQFMRVGVQSFRGHDERTLARLGDQLLKKALGGMLFTEMLDVIAEHKRRGDLLVIASSALPFQVEPLARELGFDQILCTQLETRNDIYTGRVHGPILWGPGKAAAVRAFAAEHDISLEDSFAYGNGEEDIEYLSTVGKARAVNPDAGLEEHAERVGWPIIRCGPRGKAGPVAAVRTMAAYGGLFGAFGAGVALSPLLGRRRMVDFTFVRGSDAMLALSGVSLRVTGAENVRGALPAILIFNHTSLLDPLVVIKIVREHITGAGKKELLKQPIIGQMMQWANIAMLDRGNTKDAVAALQPVIERVKEGYSIIIAPEGTRMPTPIPGPFKKGPFRMAMQGQVPILPFVIRNAGEHLWRGDKVIRPGTIDAHVLPPISVADWTLDTLDERIADVRQQYIDTLTDWPRAQLTAG